MSSETGFRSDTEDERLLLLDLMLTGNEYWRMRADGTRERVDPAGLVQVQPREH